MEFVFVQGLGGREFVSGGIEGTAQNWMGCMVDLFFVVRHYWILKKID